MQNTNPRERWKTKIGLVLAMAGNAIGLGNFLRFPGKAASNGGGAFMIPYVLSLLLMAIPLMWLEWAQGRYGGIRGHGSTPGIFHAMWKHPVSKYLGVLGIFVPTMIVIYYTYIGSWTIGYAIYSLFDMFPKVSSSVLHPYLTPQDISNIVLKPFEYFRMTYTGIPQGEFLKVQVFTYIVFVGVIGLSIWLLARGITRGIEILARIAMPVLFIFAVVLVIRVFTLGHPISQDYGVLNGLAFLWEPKWYIEQDGKKIFILLNPKIWLEAAGQVFFTLSLGMGAIQCYASYVGKDDDVALSGLATTSANEFAEVVLGGSIAIPAATAFFGITATQIIASKGSFFLGFTSMPAIFGFMPAGNFLGFLWFMLLFMAALTSIVAMAQPMMAFLQDELGTTRNQSALILGVYWFLSSHICVFLNGGWQVMDFWAGTFGPPLLAFIEVILLMWIFGGDKIWREIHRGALLRVPRVFYYIAKYITPIFLGAILLTWVYQNIIFPLISNSFSQSSIEGVEVNTSVWVTRFFLLTSFIGMCFMVYFIWRKKD